MASIAFNELFKQAASRPVCVKTGALVEWRELYSHVYSVMQIVREQPAPCWILATTDTYHFLCGFLALLAAGKEVLLPPNIQPGTLKETIIGADALLTDLSVSTALTTVNIGECRPGVNSENITIEIDEDNAYLQLCTSGSTGEPKQIRKSIRTLFAEVHCLEQTWGETVGQCTFASTVSHQHIYGLLFRVLWPLCSGRVFICENVEYPEQLDTYCRRFGEMALISSPAYLKRMIEIIDGSGFTKQIKVIFSSGGPLAQDVSLAYAQKLGVTPIEVLGSTETGGIASRQQGANINTPWRKMPPVQIRRDPASGALEVQSPFCFSADWYRMGDAVELVDADHFVLLGRIDRIIKLEEKRISLDAMEKQLRDNPLIADIRVVVLEGHRTALGAVCILTDGGLANIVNGSTRLLSNELKTYLARYFDRVTLPRKWRYVAQFPYNSQGKITQQALRGLFDEARDD